MFIIKGIIAFLLIIGGIFLLGAFIVSIAMFCETRKNTNVKMSFKQFRRIYDLSPNKWHCLDNNYIMTRKEYIKEKNNGIVCKKISVSMKNYFDFWCLAIWQWKINRAEEKEENFAYEMQGLKTLSSMINKDAEEIQKRTQKEMEKLAKKIEELQNNS